MDSLVTMIEGQKKLFRHLQRLIKTFDSRPVQEKTKGYVLSILEEIELTYKNFKEDHDQICELALENTIQEKDVPYLAEDFYYDFFENYLNIKSTLLDLSNDPPVSQAQMTSTFVSSNLQNTSLTSSARLPKIELPIFNGEYIEWIPFRDMFLSLVHHNQSLTGIQKYYYLRGSCKGSPLEIINQYPASENNYAAAWKALEERYHNIRKITDQIFKRFVNIPPLTGSFKSMRELLGTTRFSLSQLKTLGVEVGDAILIFLITQKLDKQTKKEWEQSINSSTTIPPIDSMLKFLELSFRTLESVEGDTSSPMSDKPIFSSKKPSQKTFKRSLYSNNTSADDNTCPCCHRRHPLYKCYKFSSLQPTDKKAVINQYNICANCLHAGHRVSQCRSSARCQQCKLNHHTVLHNAYSTEKRDNAQNLHNPLTTIEKVHHNAPSNNQTNEHHSTNISSLAINKHGRVLLATANILINHMQGAYMVKALIDPGSQASFVTDEITHLLHLNKRKIEETAICGVGGKNKMFINYSANLHLSSMYKQDYRLEVNALIIKKLTSYKPFNINKHDLPNLKEYFLADQTFYLPSKIDILVGSDVYGEILLVRSLKFLNNIFLQESNFGWLVSGPVPRVAAEKTININHCNLEDQLRCFWEQEELIEKRKLSQEEELCESFFVKTYSRDLNGRFTVHLPFKQLIFENKLPVFNNTDSCALKRLKRLESSFKLKPTYAKAYKEFMAEYISLHHMEKIGKYPQDLPSNCFIFPHHGVLREGSSTTKLRVVFDGSIKSPSQLSLNEELSPGPALQNDLPEVISRWRRFKIGFTADLEKMFRQINICDEHQNYQCILWRDEHTNDINIYKLKTVTYGTTCAPFLALRVLKQIAMDGAKEYPLASKVLQADIYVDDVISGADNLTDAIQLKRQLCSLLKGAGFNLRKWNSNSLQLLQTIPHDQLAIGNNFQLQNGDITKALGLSWNPQTDKFCFKINYTFCDNITKSAVLSDSARLFDPLGWLAPTTILAKIMFQKLWREGLDWTDPLPKELNEEWAKFRIALKGVEDLTLPRWFKCVSTAPAELHAFCDASKFAFAAALYVRTISEDETINVSLVQSKTKVAPLKVRTIPKLELCAAVLAAKLGNKIKQNIGLEIEKIYYWTDSTTVLSWIRQQSSNLQVYEANRVSQIQRLTNIIDWKYISSKENPADCATRGLLPQELRNYTFWWQGPHWLKYIPENWPLTEFRNKLQPVSVKINVNTISTRSIALTAEGTYPELFSKYSTFTKLQRITAYILRWCDNIKQHISAKSNNTVSITSNDNKKEYLTSAELKRATLVIIKQCQKTTFQTEINCLLTKKPLPLTSKIIKLQPFLDDNGILRVGGRIKNADLPFCKKYPILLSKKDPISFLIFTDVHYKTLHGGVQLMQAYVMSNYWIISARTVATAVKRKCIVCLKYSAKASQQIMGNLPAVRIQPARPFKHSGIDYAVPINIKQSNLRKISINKGYICLFVCMCTKAVHLELVSSLTTEAFLSAFKRFIARRGQCTDLYSDCGTTFIGASKELQALHHRSKTSLAKDLTETLHNDGTNWHFIPPASPHFGGLWEAGVKATKHHLRRVMRDRVLNFEELSTLLCQIESCLNSRPLCPLSNDPSDLNVLTPAHFLVGEPTTCIPDEDLLNTSLDRLNRWKQIEKLKQHFWERWSKEYLSRLQSRPKWNSINREAQVGDLVLLLHERSSPGSWPLARIEKVHPGENT